MMLICRSPACDWSRRISAEMNRFFSLECGHAPPLQHAAHYAPSLPSSTSQLVLHYPAQLQPTHPHTHTHTHTHTQRSGSIRSAAGVAIHTHTHTLVVLFAVEEKEVPFVCVCVCVCVTALPGFLLPGFSDRKRECRVVGRATSPSVAGFFFRFLILNHERNETKDERLINGQHKNGLRFNQAVDPTNPVERKSINLQKKNPVNNPVNNNNNNNNRKRNTDQSVVG